MTTNQGRAGDVLTAAYRLDKLLAVGGMGEVYKATHFSADGPKQVAVKVLHKDFAANAEVVARFLREARVSNTVAHPNVVTVLDTGQDAFGVPFLVQELLEGMDLAKWLEKKGGVVPPRAALAVLLPIARALAVAHALGVVHRDVKPENVFLARGADGRVVPKLVDFGISRLIADEVSGARLTAQAPMGTPAYMAPEQARSARDVDGRADIWSAGVVLYELLTGRFPYDATDPNQLVAAIVTSHPRKIEYVAPDLPPSIIALVGACLVRERENRLTAEQLVAALEKAREDVASSAADPLAFPLANVLPPSKMSASAREASTLAPPAPATDVGAETVNVRGPAPRSKMEIFAACVIMLVLGVALSYAVLVFFGK